HLLGVEGARAAGDPLAEDASALVDEDAHRETSECGGQTRSPPSVKLPNLSTSRGKPSSRWHFRAMLSPAPPSARRSTQPSGRRRGPWDRLAGGGCQGFEFQAAFLAAATAL